MLEIIRYLSNSIHHTTKMFSIKKILGEYSYTHKQNTTPITHLFEKLVHRNWRELFLALRSRNIKQKTIYDTMIAQTVHAFTKLTSTKHNAGHCHWHIQKAIKTQTNSMKQLINQNVEFIITRKVLLSCQWKLVSVQ